LWHLWQRLFERTGLLLGDLRQPVEHVRIGDWQVRGRRYTVLGADRLLLAQLRHQWILRGSAMHLGWSTVHNGRQQRKLL
jgi:hypothetical protein